MAFSHQITFSISSSSGAISASGYDNETGNTEINTNPTFPAASVNVALSLAFTVANVQDVFLWSDKGGTIKTNGTSTADVQTITITGTPTGGDFPLTFLGQTTIVAFNSSAATVQAALRLLSTIGSPNVTCTGGPLPGTPVVCTFAGTLTPGLQPLMTTFSGSLTGGASPTVTITHTTLGLPSNTIVLPPGNPIMFRKSVPSDVNPFTVDVASATFSCTPASRLRVMILTS